MFHPPPECQEQMGSVNIRGINEWISFNRCLGSTYRQPMNDHGDGRGTGRSPPCSSEPEHLERRLAGAPSVTLARRRKEVRLGVIEKRGEAAVSVVLLGSRFWLEVRSHGLDSGVHVLSTQFRVLSSTP